MNIPIIKSGTIILGAFILLFIPLSSQAITIVVEPTDDLGEALALVAAGDTVLVAPGEYVANKLAMPSGVVLAALDPNLAPELYSTSDQIIMYCENLSADTRVEGMIFSRSNTPQVKVPARGGGVYCLNSPVVFTNCSFIDLRANYGGAVYCARGEAPSFINCVFENNFCFGSGGAINVVGGQNLLLDHCLFIGNAADGGGSVLNVALSASARMTNCTLDGNGQSGLADVTVWNAQLVEIGNSIITGSIGRATYGDYDSTPWYHCSDVFGNMEGNWAGALADQAELDGNISLDPLFCGPDGTYSPYDLAEDSPCAADSNPGCGFMGAMVVGCESSTGIDGLPDEDITQNMLPQVTQLTGNYPNPFNPQTTIAFDLNRAGHASVEVYDLAGRQVRTLHSGVLAAGSHDVMWNGRGDDGRMSAAGVYFFRLKTESVIDTRRMMLVK